MANPTTQPMSPFAMGNDPESARANQEYKAAMDKLRQTYEARNEKPFFDPKMLSLAQAFAKPTQTGSFFESLGNVAGSLGASQEAEQKKAEDLAKMRLELAGMGVNQAQQQSTMQMLRQRAGVAPTPSGPGAAAAQTGIPAGEPNAALAGAPPAEGAPFSIGPEAKASQPSQFEGMNVIGRFQPPPGLIKDEQEFYRRAMSNGMRDPAEIDKAWFQYQKDFLSPKFEGGQVSDPRTGIIYGKDTGATGTANFMTGQGGSYSLPEPSVKQHQQLVFAAQKNPDNPEVWNKLESFENFWRQGRTSAVPKPQVQTIQQGAPAAPGAPALSPTAPTARPIATPATAPVAAATPPKAGGLRSAEEKRADDERRAMELRLEEEKQKKAQAIKNIKPEKLAEQEAKTEVEARDQILNNRREADTTITFANQFRKFAELPGASKMFGILNNDKISSGIAALVETGIGVPGYTIGIPAIEDVMRNANLNTTEQAQYRNFLQITTQMQLQRAKYLKGGVSNLEQGLLGQAGVNSKDTPETIRMKADLMAARAQFDRKVQKEQAKSKLEATEFLNSTRYDELLDDYDALLLRLINGETSLKATPRKAAPARVSGSVINNADSLLGIR